MVEPGRLAEENHLQNQIYDSKNFNTFFIKNMIVSIGEELPEATPKLFFKKQLNFY